MSDFSGPDLCKQMPDTYTVASDPANDKIDLYAEIQIIAGTV